MNALPLSLALVVLLPIPFLPPLYPRSFATSGKIPATQGQLSRHKPLVCSTASLPRFAGSVGLALPR